MPFSVAPCTDADMPRAFSIISSAFGHKNPWMEYVFPAHDTLRGRAAGVERLQAFNASDPHTTFLKATDVDTGAVVGVVKWNVYDGVVPDEIHELEGDYWPNATEKELADAIWNAYLGPRRKAVKEEGGRIVSLDIQCVDPEFQRRGAGRLLVQWGTEIADRMGVKTVVEATPEGRGLYASEGFEVEIEDYTVPLPEKFSDRPTQHYTWMVRPAKIKE